MDDTNTGPGRAPDTKPVIKGEFVTDGETYVLRIAGTPLTGTGPSADAAFADLMDTRAQTGAFAERLEQVAREQESDAVRATVVRWVIIAFIVFGAVGGVLVAAASLAGKVGADLGAAPIVETDVGTEPPLAAGEGVGALVQQAGAVFDDADAPADPL